VVVTASFARTVPETALPIIDIGGLRSPVAAERHAVAVLLREACIENGFFYITNHGISAALIDAVMAEARAFFAAPLVEKQAVARDLSSCHRGYEKFGGQILQAGALPDRKEAFDLGLDLPADDPRVLAGKPDHGPNLWPAGRALFRAAMTDYLAAMLDLSRVVLGGLAVSLGLDEDHFAALWQDPVVFLRLIHYPPQPPVPIANQMGAGAHTDWGAITLLWQDQTGGLQLRAADGEWIQVPPLPGCYIVNIGDLIARWTNDLYRSTVHRVINQSGRDRYSIPFFFDGNPDYVVECLPGCSGADRPAKYQPITVARHTAEQYRLAFANG
jgi:isopenicillin N synthase-like dioxygenase